MPAWRDTLQHVRAATVHTIFARKMRDGDTNKRTFVRIYLHATSSTTTSLANTGENSRRLTAPRHTTHPASLAPPKFRDSRSRPALPSPPCPASVAPAPAQWWPAISSALSSLEQSPSERRSLTLRMAPPPPGVLPRARGFYPCLVTLYPMDLTRNVRSDIFDVIGCQI